MFWQVPEYLEHSGDCSSGLYFYIIKQYCYLWGQRKIYVFHFQNGVFVALFFLWRPLFFLWILF